MIQYIGRLMIQYTRKFFQAKIHNVLTNTWLSFRLILYSDRVCTVALCNIRLTLR